MICQDMYDIELLGSHLPVSTKQEKHLAAANGPLNT